MPPDFNGEKGNATDEQISGHNAIASELPFLVTQWLANYGNESATANAQDPDREEAINRIRRASLEIASAFSVLGAYGIANRATFEQVATSNSRNASFSDVARRWSALSGSHLETVVQSSASNTIAMLTSAERNAATSSLVNSAYESTSRQNDTDGGRRLGGANEDSQAETLLTSAVSALHPPPLLAAIPGRAEKPARNALMGSNRESTLPHQRVAVPVESDYDRISKQAARCTRRLLALRESCLEAERDIVQIQRSINIQNEVKKDLQKERERAFLGKSENPLGTNGDVPHSQLTRTSLAIASKEQSDKLAEIKTREDTCEMTIAHLTVKLTDLVNSRNKRDDDVRHAVEDAKTAYRRSIILRLKFLDPFQQSATSSLPIPVDHCGPYKRNCILSNITTRQYGGGGSWRQTIAARRLFGRSPGEKAVSLVRKAVLSNRLSHAVTINSHLAYPVYCLCFDRTGRYFMTGADDFLAKVFYLGPAQSCNSERGDDGGQKPRCNYGANTRGAVLVCTLRGHAGVICDIDVSMDNALLATASDDGDCRIWGLKDGCPVAILRGHTGGANMVTWSPLSPYRLTTIGSDGLARMWDVREAALKRYGAHVGKRVDYLLPLTDSEKEALSEEALSNTATPVFHNDASAPEPVVLPPLPEPNSGLRNVLDAQDGNGVSRAAQEEPRIEVPPLPPGVGPIGHEAVAAPAQNEAGVNAGNEVVEGAFVANDAIDEGVRLISKLQHGDIVQGQQGPSTRSSRNAIKVICVARCPLGGHFVTGSDDGLGRIWADEDDIRIDIIDQKYSDCVGSRGTTETRDQKGTRKSSRVNPTQFHFRDADAPSTSRLLATLVGHVNAITDLQYSHGGDRILTASQKDGVVRVWSWGGETASGENAALSYSSVVTSGGHKFSDLKQVLIRLRHPAVGVAMSPVVTQSSRRRGGTASSASSLSKAMCDVAVWTSNDSKIVTSQCCLAQATGSKIFPGSQFLLIWDSHTGQCLMGISEAHTEICSVLVTHPTDPSILCSAGADGRVNVWDLASGRRMLTHQNTVDHGPVEPQTDRGKKSGYLDGSFSPDGNILVLTDDSGRITLFDSLVSPSTAWGLEVGATNGSCFSGTHSSAPLWMQEQYFANDYYELYYDANGYCVDKGSQLPPYLAPRAARCSHAGVPYAEDISRAFRGLVGPLPLSQQDCRWHRESIRSKAAKIRRFADAMHQNAQEKRALIMGEYDRNKTVMINCTGDEIPGSEGLTEEWVGARTAIRQPGAADRSGNRPASQRNVSVTGRPLSSNYRWRDYDDILREEEGGEEDGDTDDEEFVESARSNTAFHSDDDSSRDSLEAELSDEDSMSERRMRRMNGSSTRRVQSARSRRVNRRSRAREHAVSYEQRSLSQPTRVSRRQLMNGAERTPYAEPDTDEDTAEFLSTNNTPSGPYVEDYTVARHYFRMPTSARVWNKWLLRQESKNSYIGTKNYAPQVGDSVVYIPRAHYDTIRQFPTLHPPWKKWPTNSAWPVVRCTVRDIRYRFPYEDYYRGTLDAKIVSVVAILTLEVTGIPEISHDRTFPWPKPLFISRQTRSSSLAFEVSVFQGSQADYVIPEHLYLWRLETLETAIKENDHNVKGVEVVSYYGSETINEGEDPDLVPYDARLVGMNIPTEPSRDLHIRGSGYLSLKLEWNSGGDDDVCPWEIVVKDNELEFPPPPQISEPEKCRVIDLLKKVCKRPGAQEWFMRPVDVIRYSDYLSRVEVPMDFGIIQSRLEADFYSNKLSFLADVRLVRDNCIKYNDANNEVSKSAIEIYEFVEGEINKMETVAPSPSRLPRQQSSQEARRGGEQNQDYVRQSPLQPRPSRESRRRRMSNGFTAVSSLELLPPPMVAGGVASNSRNAVVGNNASEGSREARPRRETDTRGRGRTASVRRRTRSDGTEKVSESEDNPISEEDRNIEEPSSEDDNENSSASESYSDGNDVTDHSETEQETLPSRRSSRRHSTTQQAVRGASTRKRRARSLNTVLVNNAEAPRRSVRSRKTPKPKQPVEESYSSPDEEDVNSNNDPSEFEGNVASRRSSRLHACPQRRSSPRRGRSHCTYVEVESDDSGLTDDASVEKTGEDCDEQSDDESTIVQTRTSKARSNRPRHTSPRTSPAKRGRVGSAPRQAKAKRRRVSKQKTAPRDLPDLKEWPQIDVKQITAVAKAVMERMEDSDLDKVFDEPVSEKYPEISEEYNRTVPNPMDYRTIVEDRIPCYQSILELQSDLILVFRNCTAFNEPGTDLWKYAVSMWEMLNDVFRNVCKDLDVLLPRRW